MIFGKKQQQPEYTDEEFNSVQSNLRSGYTDEDFNRLLQLSRDLEVLDFLKKARKNVRFYNEEGESTLNVNSRGYLTSVSKTKTAFKF